MPLAFQSAGGIDWLSTIQSCQAFLHCLVSLPGLEETQVLRVKDLSYGEAIMNLGNLNVFRLES